MHLTWWTAHTTIDGEILAVGDLNGDGWGYDIATVA